ncbi:hypothetical protein Q4603_21310 [Zobellia galactanivorans]|uniref:hypothetical protein n=1 Tax=Zobellia galactanivorans (strain DSM 12802 / CCUG 47099 / CIP 106680 / NCIMB 13871 / Dsij) TaxID=63186 RepID=UPI0026E1B66E|nr:hypothetical protein [Zobellia galactanivorans]MDO6811171.1 hypothetical protein [Zobellia galactanivorans]
MKRVSLIGSIVLVLALNSCGSLAYQGYEMSSSHHETAPKEFELEVKVVYVQELRKETNSIKVDYEVMNRSEDIFLSPQKKYNVFFKVKTKDGREIGHYKSIYRKIAPNSSIILSETINLSVYEYESVEAKIFVE